MRARYVLAAAVAAFLAMTMVAQAADVYVGDGTTGNIWAFTGTIGAALMEDSPFADIQGLALTANGQILVADSQVGIARLDPVTGSVMVIEPQASPVDVYPDCQSEDIYYITAMRCSALYVLLGGNGPGEQCLSLPSTPLDLQVYPSGERAGHVVILLAGSGDCRASLREFHRTGQTAFEELPPILESIHGDPVNFAIRPDGRIVLLDSERGMYDVGPEGNLVHFGPHEVERWEKIDIGANGTIYVTDTELRQTHRFDPEGNWIHPSLEGGVEVPAAVAAVGFVPTPPGPNVPVNPTEGVEILFEQVAQGGYTSADATSSSSRVSPGGNTLPDYAQPPVGRTGFTYVSLATTAVFENLIQIDVFLPGTRLFFAHGTGEVFQDATVVGSIEDARGVVSRFSEVVLVEDTRSVNAVVNDKFVRLFDILSGDGDTPGSAPDLAYARRSLVRYALRAKKLYQTGFPSSAIGQLSQMNDEIRRLAGTAIPNSSDGPEGNVAGEMLARSKTLMFSLSLLARPSDLPRTGSIGSETALTLTCASPARGECRFELAGPSGVRVVARLYTVNGSLVKTLFEGDLTDGGATLSWDGTDRDGRRVASGVYLTRVESGDALVMGKVVFVR
jgi:hypothetical protein